MTIDTTFSVNGILAYLYNIINWITNMGFMKKIVFDIVIKSYSNVS